MSKRTDELTQVTLIIISVTGGDLFSYVVKHRRLGEAEAKFVMWQLLKGVDVSVSPDVLRWNGRLD